MKKVIGGWAVVFFIFAAIVAAQWNSPKDNSSITDKTLIQPRQPIGEQYALRESADPASFGTAAVDTYTIAYYTFGTMDWQGWTRLDRTAQIDTFWHVEDYAEPVFDGLSGPLEGTKSALCGVPPAPPDYLCHWKLDRGYGDYWDQSLVSDPIPIDGYLDVSYRVFAYCEENYDFLRVEYDAGGGFWRELASYTGLVNTTAQHRISSTNARTKLRFHFMSDMTASPEDGVDTGGLVHVDSITIAGADSLIDYEDFEGSPENARRCGIWHADVGPAFGMYSGLRLGLGTFDKDPCNDNFTTQVVFFMDSPYESSSYPGLYDTPFCKGLLGHESLCQNEMIVSPVIDLTRYSTGKNNVQDAEIPPAELPLMGGIWLRFTAYEDLPPDNGVIYNWYVRQVDPSGCRGIWNVRSEFFPLMGKPSYAFIAQDISKAVGAADSIQIGLGVIDMCAAWHGSCAQHTPAPWFDNIEVVRFRSEGPQWSYRDQDLFQDNFPTEEFSIESYVRADAANDINAASDPAIRPGDSVVVECNSAIGGGLAADPGGGPAIYMHVKCGYIGPDPAKPPLAGSTLQGSYGVYRSDDGIWTIIQGDTARAHGKVAADYYMFDLNDSILTRGYEIEYYFTARNNAGYESALPRWCRSTGPYFEFTCLPTKNSDVLYVDDCHGRGSFEGTAENYWMSTLRQISPLNVADRYDVMAPAAGVSNGLGGRAKVQQLIDSYQIIIWDSGDLSRVTISDGTPASDKSNDCQILVEWMDMSPHRVGLWICGDDVAADLKALGSVPALTLLGTWCGIDMVNTSYFERTGGLTGGVVNPMIVGDEDAGIYVEAGVPNRFSVYGGCPSFNSFDMLEAVGSGRYALNYPDFEGIPCRAAIASWRQNAGAYDVKTMWFGFSMQYVRDDGQDNEIDRLHIVEDVLNWMDYPVQISEAKVPGVYALDQNFPNPFNPTTSIRFAMKERALVTIKIYNVAGQRVRTLIDGVKGAGSYSITWDGKNNLGADVGSGIYFYKMETKGFTQTKKMVLLR
jgi:hypothetical protein